MKTINKLKILNDPVYGFITIPNELIYDLIEHPYFQRLRRITQMGLSYLVYPGAHHTRFHHAIGCMHLMQKAVRHLRLKGVEINEEEEIALYIAILLHDIGHGPFSHALEHSIVKNISHEYISLRLMQDLNIQFDGKLNLALEIFEGKYHRNFFNQLVSGQLDMDRLDYLKRDSFFTGVAEGNISSERLISMLNVVNDQVVLDEKGIYSAEKFIVARRLMYWQVYLHKTCLVAELTLSKLLERARVLTLKGKLSCNSSALAYFLKHQVTDLSFDKKTLSLFAQLDDYDVMMAIKEWIHNEDPTLAYLAQSIQNRNLFKIEMSHDKFNTDYVNEIKLRLQKQNNHINEETLSSFFFEGRVSNQAYNTSKQSIQIQYKKGKLLDLSEASDQLNIQALSKPVVKHYICYPKNNRELS